MENSNRKTLFIAIISVAVALTFLGTATFAWFTSNSRVSTNTVSGRSGSADIKFLIGPDEGNMTETSDSGIEIAQVNSVELEHLYPVSTADLSTFLYCDDIQDNMATHFAVDSEESNFYHGRIYLRLEGENVSSDSTYKLFLDKSEDSGGEIGSEADQYIMNAARLGLKFDNSDQPVILKFDATESGPNKTINTVVDGSVISGDQVLDSSGKPVSDPAEEFSIYTLDSSDENTELPEKELTTMTINETVMVDVYFYLEGCDEDCVDADISLKGMDIHLAFYAVASSE